MAYDESKDTGKRVPCHTHAHCKKFTERLGKRCIRSIRYGMVHMYAHAYTWQNTWCMETHKLGTSQPLILVVLDAAYM